MAQPRFYYLGANPAGNEGWSTSTGVKPSIEPGQKGRLHCSAIVKRPRKLQEVRVFGSRGDRSNEPRLTLSQLLRLPKEAE